MTYAMGTKNRKIARACCLLLAAWLCAIVYPINTWWIRGFTVAEIPLLATGATLSLWPYRRLRWLPFSLLIAFFLVLLLPGRNANTQALRLRYIAEMRGFEGTRYVWGGYGGRTIPILTCDSLRTPLGDSIQPGDLAITTDGVHIMGYIGNNQWIEANPAIGRVVVLSASDHSPWLDRRMAIVRWRLLR